MCALSALELSRRGDVSEHQAATYAVTIHGAPRLPWQALAPGDSSTDFCAAERRHEYLTQKNDRRCGLILVVVGGVDAGQGVLLRAGAWRYSLRLQRAVVSMSRRLD